MTKVVDIRTTEITDIIDGYTEAGTDTGLESVAGIAEKFHRAFPLIKGKIVQKEGGCFLADMEGDIRNAVAARSGNEYGIQRICEYQ